MDNVPEEMPIGLGFAFLKGSLAYLNDTLNEGDPENVHHARVMLDSAMKAFQAASEKSEGRVSLHIEKQLEKLGEGLIEDSHTMLDIASSWLSSEVKLV